MATQDRLAYLLQLAVSGAATTTELDELSALLRDGGNDRIERLAATLLPERASEEAPVYDEAYWNQVVDHILAADRPAGEAPVPKIRTMPPLRRWLAAAAVGGLLALSGAAYWWLQRPAAPPALSAAKGMANDVAPGSNKAVLTLSDGSELQLDSTASGLLTKQGSTQVAQSGAGQLTYTAASGVTTGGMVYNILRTQRGGQFSVTLPDGTRVWLNSASTLKYPTAFTGKERKVILSGEAYFEVAANTAKPFRVNVLAGTDSMEIAVLGTHFNVMAYDEESKVKTALLEGAVRVSGHGSSTQLRPGQGASLDKNSHVLVREDHINTEEAVAWKNGFMQLEGSDIASVMRQIARWYDVEVIYNAPVDTRFWGVIPRSVPLSQVLKTLELTGKVHFRISGKQLIVSP